MDLVQIVSRALEFIFPAYCANAVPVLAGGGPAMDFGKKLSDGRPVFGKNKTFRGFFAGLAVGTVAGLAESLVFNYHIMFGLLLSLGALLGDLAGAFVKRRLAIPPGGLLPVVDQLDFIMGAILFSLPLYMPWSWQLFVTVLIITPPVHLLTNFFAYKLRLKSNPW
ncbi:MAG: CDP-2,3-bis-(O-geranylgeranyl)-sn-glycerol synthase [Candidatus Bathyarchaeia archaeon]